MKVIYFQKVPIMLRIPTVKQKILVVIQLTLKNL